MPDHNLLELVLFYAIPQKDVKPLSYDLINHFGSFEKVFSADVEELMMVDGVKEHTAILLSLFKQVNLRINQNRAKETIKYNDFDKICKFASDMLKSYKHEVIMIITVDNNSRIINHHIVPGATPNNASITKKLIAQFVIRDDASSVIIAHNHPEGPPTPSGMDISFTQSVSGFLREIGLSLTDHVIVGEGGTTQSLKGDLKYAKYFD